MNLTPLVITLALIVSACSKQSGEESGVPTDQLVNGELAEVAKARGLAPHDLIASMKTYNPSGASEEFLAFFGTGVAGRLAVVAMPSMKTLKYVSVFSAEPWQGYAFDDESKAILKGSSRDEIEYAFGDIGTPALSLTQGKHDARAVFVSDSANGRLGLVDLAEYETKQVVTHPLFRNSNPDVAVTANTEYVTQTTAHSEQNTSGITFWKFVQKESDGHKLFFIDPATSFTVLVSGQKLSSPAAGRFEGQDILLSVTQDKVPYLNVIDWKAAEKILATKFLKRNGHLTLDEELAIKEKVLIRLELPAGSEKVIFSGDGEHALITNKANASVLLAELRDLKKGKLEFTPVTVGGASVDAAFTSEAAYVTVHNPHQVVKIDLAKKAVLTTHKVDFPVGKIMIPEGDTTNPNEKFAVIVNHSPSGRFTDVGPQTGLGAQLLDIQGSKMMPLYDASIAQSTRLGAVAMSTKINKPVFKYKIGTDPRSGLLSNYKTASGKEKIVRDGKRVHVYASVIRSHITPDLIEVEQGDIVSVHITSNEQSRDQVHGFTIDTYNVHGSWEPGKTATVTFVADRPGVFPFYCTEFCSALHLEMQGYLLVKPATDKKVAEADELMKLHKNSTMNNFFKYLKGE